MSTSPKIYKILRKCRIAVSVAVFAAVFAAVALGYDVWLNRWQVVPAVMACAVSWILLWFVVTAAGGRIYCSTVCPMGTLMDVFGKIGHRGKGYFYSSPRVLLRRSLFVISVGAALAGIPVMIDVLDPAAAVDRMAVWGVSPMFKAVTFSAIGGLLAFATLVFVGVAGWRRGRLLCNTVCPVGALLGEISKYSVYHIDINTDKCVGCGKCTEVCKAECISPTAHTVDPSRCVVCFNCTAVCPNMAITYRRGRHRLVMPMMQTVGPNTSSMEDARRLDRRDFLSAVLAGVPLAALGERPTDPLLEPLNPVHPPGLTSSEDLRLKCTACGACSATCPTGIIRPMERGIRSPLRPVLGFDSGACVYDCVRCTEVCPTGCLKPLTVSEKHHFVIGKARVVAQFCIEYNEGEGCGMCARRCPRRAIKIEVVDEPEAALGESLAVPEKTARGRIRRLPQVDEAMCIGCGECRYVCPARPRAFIIEGEP